MTVAPQQPTSLRSARNASLIGSLMGGHAVVHWFANAFPVLLAEIVTSLGLSPLAAGTIMAARSISGALANVPMGIASDRFASQRSLFMGSSILWFGGGYFLVSMASNQGALVVFAAVLGVATALWHPPAIGLLSTRFSERRAFVLALHGVGASVGDIAGPLLAGGMLLAMSWQGAFRATLLPAFVIAVIFLLAMRGVSTSESRGNTTLAGYFIALRNAAKHRPLLLALLAQGFRTAGAMVLVTFLPLYARDDLGLGPGLVGVLMASLMGSAIVSQPVLGYVSDRTGRKFVIVPSMVTLTVITPLLAAFAGGMPLLAVAGSVGLFLFSMGTLMNVLALDIAPTELQSTTVAATFITGLVLGSASPVIAGGIANATSVEVTFYFAAALFAVAAVMVALLPSHGATTRAPLFAG